MFRRPSEITSSSETENSESQCSSPSQHHQTAVDAPTSSVDLEPLAIAPTQLAIAPTQLANHTPILLGSLLEYYVRNRMPTRHVPTDAIYLNVAHRLTNLGFVPQTSGDIGREDLAPVRQAYLAGVDHLLYQEITAITTDLSGRNRGGREGGTNSPLRGLLNDLGTKPDLNGKSIHRTSSLSALGDILGGSGSRATTATNAGTTTDPASFFRSHSQDMPHPEILLPPSRYASDFVEISLLGRGGFGSVYHVRNRLDGVEYAVKKIILKKGLFDSDLGGKREGVQKVLKEIKTLARLQHQNIVRYFGSWVEGMIGDMLITPRLLEEQVRVGLERLGGSAASSLSDVDTSGGVVFGYSDNRIETLEESVATTASGVEDGDIEYASGSNEGVSTSHAKQHTGGKVVFDLVESDTESDISASRIFSSGNGALVRSVTKYHNRRPSSVPSGLALHIQMSLHPLTLTSFISFPNPSKPTKKHCFCLKSSLRILSGLLEGVGYLHSQGIAHRDLKPGNVFLDHSERGCECGETGVIPRIGDFGLVAEINTDATPNTAVGTDFYKPAGADDTDDGGLVGRDIFALGVILLELVLKFETRMERFDVLSKLSRDREIPQSFEELAGKSTMEVLKGCCGIGGKHWEIRRIKEAVITILDELSDGGGSGDGA